MSTFSPAEGLKLSKGLPGPAPNPLGSPPGRRRACRQSADGGFRFAAHEAVQFVGGRPTASSFLARPRKEPKKGARGLGGLPGHRCAPRLRRAPQSGDAHSKRATGATCPFGTNGVPIRAVASRPLWIPRRESPCDPALRAGTLSGAAFGGGDCRVPPRRRFWICRVVPGGAFTGIAARGRQELLARSAAHPGFLFGRTKRNQKSA